MLSTQTSTWYRRFYQLFLFLAFLLASHNGLADAVGVGAGVVRDTTGAAIPGAKITLTRLSTNAVLSRVSDAGGAFVFVELAPDTYTLTVEANGFKRTSLTRVVIQVDQASKLDVVLQPGDVSEYVNVDIGAPLIDTEQNTLSNVVDNQGRLLWTTRLASCCCSQFYAS